MKAIFGAVLLLVVLGIVGSVVVRQLKSMSASHGAATSASSAGSAATPGSPRAIEDQFKRDLDRAMQSASAARAVD